MNILKVSFGALNGSEIEHVDQRSSRLPSKEGSVVTAYIGTSYLRILSKLVEF